MLDITQNKLSLGDYVVAYAIKQGTMKMSRIIEVDDRSLMYVKLKLIAYNYQGKPYIVWRTPDQLVAVNQGEVDAMILEGTVQSLPDYDIVKEARKIELGISA